MLSLYRAWLGPSPCVARPAPPPGAHRPVPRRPKPPSPPPASPSSTTSSELDVERIEITEDEEKIEPNTGHGFTVAKNAVVDVASCDGPVRFIRVLNTAWKETEQSWTRRKRATVHYYPCKTCGSKFPSYYFVHKHRKRCHGEEKMEKSEASTSATIQ